MKPRQTGKGASVHPPRHGGTDAVAKIFGVRASGKDFLDFSISINPLGPPPGLMEALTQALEAIPRYPEIDAKTLSERLASQHGITPEHIIVGNGSSDLLFSLIPLLPVKCAVIPYPTFIEYERACQIYGWHILHIPPRETTNFTFDGQEILSHITPKAALFLCQPNNPTGQCMESEMLEKILDRAEKNRTFIILDEAFLPFTDMDSAIPRVLRHKTLIVLRSMTKSYGIPGLRLGYAVASPRIISRWKAYLPPWNVNVLAQTAGIYCLENGGDHLDRSKAFIREEMGWMAAEIRKNAPFVPLPSETNFSLAFINSDVLSADDIFFSLGKRGILVRHCGSFRGMGNRHIRIGIKKRADNQRLIAALRDLAGDISSLHPESQLSAGNVS